MKYVFLVGDGMGDYSYDELDGKTVLEYARTPNLDKLAQQSTLGVLETIPDGFSPGSDVGNLTLLGYDPRKYYTGRAPLEAASMGVALGERDLAIRCNLITLSEDYKIMKDYSAGHISTEQAKRLIALIGRELRRENLELYPGISYRHLLVWRNAPVEPKELQLTPPHEIPDQPIKKYLPQGLKSNLLMDLIERSRVILSRQESAANSIWLWGAGYKPQMPTLQARFGINGSVISAVDLVKGLGVYAGLTVREVPGATGYLDTNYAGKVCCALETLSEADFVYVHVEAPDECGHQGRLDLKLKAIEDFDAKIVGPVLEGLKQCFEDFSVLVTTDHYTPARDRVHVAAPVPFLIYRNNSKSSRNSKTAFHERAAATTNLHIRRGHELLSLFLNLEVSKLVSDP
jgi:2,3-bisphosphoglycerate-independent phosphoglycerate mutase